MTLHITEFPEETMRAIRLRAAQEEKTIRNWVIWTLQEALDEVRSVHSSRDVPALGEPAKIETEEELSQLIHDGKRFGHIHVPGLSPTVSPPPKPSEEENRRIIQAAQRKLEARRNAEPKGFEKAASKPSENQTVSLERLTHDSSTCRVYGCFQCKALGVSNPARGL